MGYKGLFTILLLVVVILPGVISDTINTQADIGNSAPVASSVAIAAGNLNGGDIALNANVTTQINISATITDNNGCTDISSVNATLFRTNLTGGSGAADDNRSHYSIASCTVQAGTCTGASDLAADYDCYVNVTWYADATDAGSAFAATNWTVNVTPYDGSGLGTADNTIYDLATLTAFYLSSSNINFGSLSLGQNTSSTNQNVTVTNSGNEGLDFSFTGYGASSGDNYSMNCSLGNIEIHLLEYNNTAFTYGRGTDLTNTSTELDFDLDRGNETTQRFTTTSFYGLAIPSDGVGGSCTGNIVIAATSDPTLD